MKRTPPAAQVAGSDRSAFVSRLRLILRHWPSADRLARAMGVSPSAFRKWLKGEAEPSRERLVALAEVAQVSIGWLARGEGPEPTFIGPGRRGQEANGDEQAPRVEPSCFVMFPGNGASRQNGPSDASNGPEPTFIAFHNDWIRDSLRIDPHALAMVIATGSAMTPTIRDGDLLLVDTSDKQIRCDGIYAFDVGGYPVVRRVHRLHDGGVALLADNRCYTQDVVPPDKLRAMSPIGRVVWSAGQI
jgi:phage repressor protein C with HTH and peptisase S24 domain